MSMSSLPPHLHLRLGLLRADPEFQELLQGLKETQGPWLPLYKRSPLAEGVDSNKQKDDWIFASGMVQGWNLLMAHFGPKAHTHEENET